MRHETCQYCGCRFSNEAGYERHLKPDFTCMDSEEMARTEGFYRTLKGWAHSAKPVMRRRPSRRPPDLFSG